MVLVAFGWLPKAPTVDGKSCAGFLCPTSSDLRVRNAHGAAAQLVGQMGAGTRAAPADLHESTGRHMQC